MVQVMGGQEEPQIVQVQTLGTIRLTREGTNERILIPTPSIDPADPLNWSQAYKLYLAGLVTFALFMANFLVAGPAISLPETAAELYHVIPPTPLIPTSLEPENVKAFQHAINQLSYTFSGAAAAQGVSNFMWMPLAVKYGRRPVYILSFLLYCGLSIWAGRSQSFASNMAARILMAWSAGTAECICPLTIADIFFLHERGFYMALYSAALASGAAFGSVVGGLLSLRADWRVLYYLGAGVIGLLTILIIFTMPETAFDRMASRGVSNQRSGDPEEESGSDKAVSSHLDQAQSGIRESTIPHRKAFRLFPGTMTQEPLWQIFIRPVEMLILPPVVWATLVLAILAGGLIIISTSISTIFSQVYGFETWKIGLITLALVVGACVGVPLGGLWLEFVSNKLTQRNNGIREPEHRLPALIISTILLPGSLLILGFSYENKLHYMVPAFGLFLFCLSMTTGGVVSITYMVDSYRPIAGEVVVAQFGYKSIIAFVFSFYTNPWIDALGYAGAFGTMAGISFGILVLWIPFYFVGKRIRHTTFKWKLLRSMKWNMDREVGE